jgi:hypothetical protein
MAGYRQSKTGTWRANASGLGLLKFIEQFFQVLGVNTNSGIAYPNLDAFDQASIFSRNTYGCFHPYQSFYKAPGERREIGKMFRNPLKIR